MKLTTQLKSILPKINQVVEWMAENRVLSAALEGNIDQVQYTDRIKSIVEFLGTRLSNEELSKVSL